MLSSKLQRIDGDAGTLGLHLSQAYGWDPLIMDAAARRSLLRNVSFGARVAEDETVDLISYFVETEQWRQVWDGDVDVVFGPKGSGKSAIYSMLVSRANALFDRGILLAPAENPTGSPAFSVIEDDPPTSEQEFVNLWKLYFLSLIADVLHEYAIRSDETDRMMEVLDRIELLPKRLRTKAQILQSALAYIQRLLSPKEIEGTVQLDPTTSAPVSFSSRIVFREPTASERRLGAMHVDDLFRMADGVLSTSEFGLWLVLDRLDVAFSMSRELEVNALRALFRVYRDLQPLNNVRVKIFLRSDIWRDITKDGFREASHITKELTLRWDPKTLLQLVSQRLVKSKELCATYEVDPSQVLADIESQEKLFYQVYPDQVDSGSRKPKTFDWCLARTRDAHVNAPRELIHLMNEAKSRQLQRYEIGEELPPGVALFDPRAIKEALSEVSEVRLTKTIYAEYPAVKQFLESMEGQKTHQNAVSLANVWQIDEAEAKTMADRLVEIGIFEKRGDVNKRNSYWVPFLYRPALKLLQGRADGVAAVEDDDDQ